MIYFYLAVLFGANKNSSLKSIEISQNNSFVLINKTSLMTEFRKGGVRDDLEVIQIENIVRAQYAKTV